MASTVSFFRELPLTVSFQGQLSALRLAAGFTKPVDPLSGMTVNLSDVNHWLKDLIKLISSADQSDEIQLLKLTQTELQKKASLQNAQVSKVQLTLESGGVVSVTAKGFQFQKKYWATDSALNLRRQITAFFSLSEAKEIFTLESAKVAKSFTENPRSLFSQFPVQPSRLEIENILSQEFTVLTL